MNILLFTAIYPAVDGLGVVPDTKAIHYFAKQWKKDGHNVEVVYIYQNPIKNIKWDTLTDSIVPKSYQYNYEGIHVNLFKTQLLVPHAERPLKSQIRVLDNKILEVLAENTQPDVLVVHFPMSFYGTSIFDKFSCKKIAVLHTCDIDAAGKFSKLEITDYLKKFNVLGSRSEKIRKDLDFYGLNSELVLSGITDDLIAEKNYISNKFLKKRKKTNIVYAGKLISRKNVDIVLKALGNVEFDFCFTVIGDGCEYDNLVKIVHRLGIQDKVQFVGRKSRRETLEYMREADIFVMVSKSETFGLVYLEAMAQGCIVIGSRGEGIDGVIKNCDNGFLVMPNDVSDLKSTLLKINSLTDIEKQTVSEKAYFTAINMTDSEMARKYLNMIIEH